MPLEYFSLPYTNREITGCVRGAGYCKFSFSSYTCSSFSIISLMYHLPWNTTHNNESTCHPASHESHFIWRFEFSENGLPFLGNSAGEVIRQKIMICLEQNWIGTMCMSKHGNECHIVGFIQPLIQEKDFTAMVTLLV